LLSNNADVTITSISGKKGTIAFGDSVSATVAGDVTAKVLEIADTASVEVYGKLTATTVNVTSANAAAGDAVLDVDKAVVITDIAAEMADDGLRIVTKRTSANESQLTINGQIDRVEVDVALEMTAAEAKALLTTQEGKAPTSVQKLATAKKASTEYINVMVKDGNNWVAFDSIAGDTPEENFMLTAYKYDGGVYVTSLDALVKVYAYMENAEGSMDVVYETYFLDWEQAVKDINALNNKNQTYQIEILRNVGQKLDGTLAPLEKLTLPSKAKHVSVGGNNIFFMADTIKPATSTTFACVGLMAVKEVEENGSKRYESTSYDVNIGKYPVVMDTITAYADVFNANGEHLGSYENMPGTFSGSKNGRLTFRRRFESAGNEIVATMIKGIGTVEFYDGKWSSSLEEEVVEYTRALVTEGMTGVQNLILHPYTYVESLKGDISVKNLTAEGGTIRAKNFSVTGVTELDRASLAAGTETVGDGAIKLANIVLDSFSSIAGKQDKDGNSLIQITGTISASDGREPEEMLQIEVWYNDLSRMAQMYDGMLLLTAPKADMAWVTLAYSWSEDRPLYDEHGNIMFDESGNMLFEQEMDEEGNPVFDEEGNPVYVQDYYAAMGWPIEGYGMYKLGKAIYYGKLAK